ncbi:hypothetical protein [Pseudoxanthomonas sp. X-1]|uniref:hypothetical protein n=1 Tax=Pseudoxanthomonas sp. X-1 TaxID=2571115 RepID=UPI00197CECB8|nr:hypothetical protein [Pseudoxanthomonas sp. X-1]UAY76803.1 hypothetical protein LAJ50_04420 [Pseudoxanthomonas sp. X-1]
MTLSLRVRRDAQAELDLRGIGRQPETDVADQHIVRRARDRQLPPAVGHQRVVSGLLAQERLARRPVHRRPALEAGHGRIAAVGVEGVQIVQAQRAQAQAREGVGKQVDGVHGLWVSGAQRGPVSLISNSLGQRLPVTKMRSPCAS